MVFCGENKISPSFISRSPSQEPGAVSALMAPLSSCDRVLCLFLKPTTIAYARDEQPKTTAEGVCFIYPMTFAYTRGNYVSYTEHRWMPCRD